jgi:multicomponent Na+:H+ antiporter subunit G
MIHGGLSLITVKLMMILLLIWVTSPTSTYALARSALTHGLEPRLADEEDAPSSN